MSSDDGGHVLTDTGQCAMSHDPQPHGYVYNDAGKRFRIRFHLATKQREEEESMWSNERMLGVVDDQVQEGVKGLGGRQTIPLVLHYHLHMLHPITPVFNRAHCCTSILT